MAPNDALISHLESMDLDIRKTLQIKQSTGISPRFMDQKCTPDVLASCAEWILHLPNQVQKEGFTTRNVWDSRAFENNVRTEFSKPAVHEATARSEIDKFIAQPLKTFTFAGLLTANLQGRSIIFRVAERQLLEYVAKGPRDARIFLVSYLERVLQQSGIYYRFESFFKSGQTQVDYLELRDSFVRFVQNNTPINGAVEIRRIFPKVLNPLSHQYGLPGAEGGKISKGPIVTSQLLYNKENFRDKGKKLKGQTRKQAAQAARNVQIDSNAIMNRVMAEVRSRHGGISELQDHWSNGHASQVHHIFPKSQYANLKAVPENLIVLTPTQHNTKAHPRNYTGAVDFDYQIDCLVAKVESVRRAQEELGDGFYELDRLIAVINHGYPDIGLRTTASFEEVILLLRSYQNGLETIAQSSRDSKVS